MYYPFISTNIDVIRFSTVNL